MKTQPQPQPRVNPDQKIEARGQPGVKFVGRPGQWDRLWWVKKEKQNYGFRKKWNCEISTRPVE